MALILAAAGAAVCNVLVVYGAAGGGADLGDVASSPLFYLGVTGAFAASIWGARIVEGDVHGSPHANFLIVLGAAALLRAIVLPAEPVLSDDIWRYLWDGHVQAAGLNPFRHSPSDPALDPLAAPYRERINNPDLPTIYPPVTQVVFLLGALLPGGAVPMKLLMVIFDMGTILALAAILRSRGMPRAGVVLYAWSPLATLEIAWSGHNDPVGVCLLVLAALAVVRSRPAASVAAASLAGAAKYAGFLALPALLRRSRWWAAAIVPAVVAAAYAPYLRVGTAALGSLPTYAERWRFNDSIFALVLGVVERTGLAPLVRGALTGLGWLDPAARWEASVALRLTEPLSIAKIAVVAGFLALAVWVLARRWKDPVREILALIGGALVLSPTLHPWYLLWVAPFLAVVPRLSWAWLTFAALVFSYPMTAVRAEGIDPLRWLALLEYIPFFVILVVEAARRRLWEV